MDQQRKMRKGEKQYEQEKSKGTQGNASKHKQGKKKAKNKLW